MRQPPAPPSRWSNQLTLVFLASAVVLGALLALCQQKSSTGIFKNKITHLEGFLETAPLARIRIPIHFDEYGQAQYKSVLLVGEGKSGAAELAGELYQKLGGDSPYIRLGGYMIYNDGKALMEISAENVAQARRLSIPDSLQAASSDSLNLPPLDVYALETQLTGEIIAPKCYFGAMKPGSGKVHKSCAVRCISGGIPPVLMSQDEASPQYFLLLGKDKKPIHQAVLDYVAESVTVSGRYRPMDDWFILYLDPQKDISPL